MHQPNMDTSLTSAKHLIGMKLSKASLIRYTRKRPGERSAIHIPTAALPPTTDTATAVADLRMLTGHDNFQSHLSLQPGRG